MVSIRIKYRLTNEGDYDGVDKVKPFVSNVDTPNDQGGESQ